MLLIVVEKQAGPSSLNLSSSDEEEEEEMSDLQLAASKKAAASGYVRIFPASIINVDNQSGIAAIVLFQKITSSMPWLPCTRVQ